MKFSPRYSFVTRSLLAAAIAIPCSALWAQSDAAPADQSSGQPSGGMRGRGPNMERQLEQLTRVLSLSADQQTQVKALLTEQRGKMEELRRTSNGAGTASSSEAQTQGGPPHREQMDAIRNDTDAKITTLLNDEQKTKYAAWQQQRKERMERRGGGGGPDGPPPPSGV